MKKLIVILFSFSLLAQSSEVPSVPTDKSNHPLKSQNVEKTEELLNSIILKLNESFQSHSKILVQKMKVLPKNTVVSKGKAKGDDCEISPEDKQEDSANDCLKVEMFDFVEAETGFPKGPQNKSIWLFFEGSGSDADSRIMTERKIKRIKSRIFLHNFDTNERVVMEVTDTEPLTANAHDEKVYTSNQINYFPPSLSKESQSGDLSSGKYKLATVENSKAAPLRNKFKREAYIKHLHYFERLCSKIYNYNLDNSNAKVKKQSDFMKSSLEY